MATVLPNAIEMYRDKAAGLYQQGADMYNTALKSQEGEGDRAMLNALAAQYAGENFQPVQAQYLKRAMGSEDLRTKKAEFLMNQARAYEQLATSAQTAQERLAAEQQYKMIMAGIAGMNAQSSRMRAEQGEGGSFTQSGFTPDGKQLVTNRTGVNFVLDVTPNGPSYTPYTGPAIPKSTFDKSVTDAQALNATAARADSLVKLVEANAPAFGLRGAAVSALPGTMQGYASKLAQLTPEQMEARSTVLRQAAQEINDLYGAALSMGEQARAAAFLPNPGDPPETTISKLKAARDWAQTKASTAYGAGVQNAAAARVGGGQPAASSPAGDRTGMSLAERNELNRLRQKYGKGGE